MSKTSSNENQQARNDRRWKMRTHDGKVPTGVQEGVIVQVQYRDGSLLISDDFCHVDLWTTEKEPSRKNIELYRFV